MTDVLLLRLFFCCFFLHLFFVGAAVFQRSFRQVFLDDIRPADTKSNGKGQRRTGEDDDERLIYNGHCYTKLAQDHETCDDEDQAADEGGAAGETVLFEGALRCGGTDPGGGHYQHCSQDIGQVTDYRRANFCQDFQLQQVHALHRKEDDDDAVEDGTDDAGEAELIGCFTDKFLYFFVRAGSCNQAGNDLADQPA